MTQPFPGNNHLLNPHWLAQGIGHKATVEPPLHDQPVPGNSPPGSIDATQSSHHGTVSQAPPLELFPARMFVLPPPASPLDGIEIRDFIPARIAAPALPRLERPSPAGLLSYIPAKLLALKDHLVGKWQDPCYTPLIGTLDSLNDAIATLPARLEALQRGAADLGTTPDAIAASTAGSTEALGHAQRALQDLLDECERASEREDGREAVLRLTIEARSMAGKLEVLSSRLEQLQDAEQGERGEWRKAINDLRERITDGDVTNPSRFSTRDLTWLAQLQKTIAAMDRPVNRETLIDALSRLMQGGAEMPETVENAQVLLAEFYPAISGVAPDHAPMQAAEALAEEQPLLATASKERYEALVARRRAVRQRRGDELRHFLMLREANQRALSRLPGTIREIEISREYQNAGRKRLGFVDDLQNYYALASRDASGKLDQGEQSRLDALKKRLMDPDACGLLERLVNPAAQESEAPTTRQPCPVRQVADDAEDQSANAQITGRATLSLLAQASIDVFRRGELLLDTDVPPDADDLQLQPDAPRAYQALDAETRCELEGLARECLQLDHQLYYYTQGEGQTDAAIDFSSDAVIDKINGLYARFVAYPEEHMELLAQRAERVQALEAALRAIIGKLPETGADSLRAPIQSRLDECVLEQLMLDRVLGDSTPLMQMQRLKQAAATQLDLQQKLGNASVSLESVYTAELLDINVKAYQLRTDALRDNITATREMALTLDARRNSMKALELRLRSRAEGLDPQAQDAGDVDQLMAALDRNDKEADLYRKIRQEAAEATLELERLKTEFRIGLLRLQEEEVRANGPDGGGYPEQRYWSSSIAHLLGDKVMEVAGIGRESPRTLLLEQQLALAGKTIGEAYLGLWSILRNPATATTKLGLTPERILKWNAAYPEEMIVFASNIRHAANALTTWDQGLSQQAARMVRTAWDRATIESVMRDAILGQRSSIVGATDAEPMPPELIALLNVAEWAPYTVGAAAGIAGGNVGARAGALAAAALSAGTAGGVVGAAGAAVIGALGGMAQIRAEKTIASELARYREANVMVNAVLKGLELDSAAGVSDRLKAMTKYVVQRDALREMGNLRTDLAEVGKIGAVKRYMQEISLIWKNSGPIRKAMLVAASAATMVGVGVAVGVLLVNPLGTAAGITIAVVAALLSIVATRALWSRLCGPVMDTVNQEMNRQRLDLVITEAKQKLVQVMAMKKQAIEARPLLKDHDVTVQVDAAAEDLEPMLGTIAGKVIKANPDADTEEIVSIFISAAGKHSPEIPKASLKQDALEEMAGQGIDREEALRLADKANQMLLDELGRTPDAARGD